MEYIVIKRTKLYKTNDMLSIEKTAKNLDEAIRFKVALEMLDSGENKSYHILIDTSDAYTYLMTEQSEEKQDKIVNIK